MSDSNPLSKLNPKTLRRVEDWENAIAQTIAVDDMLEWFEEMLDAHLADGVVRREYLNLFCGAQKRFRELAYFSRKLTPDQRKLFVDQADTIVDLVRGIWGQDAAMMARLDTALAASAEYYSRFGWPSPVWNILDFEEL
jgi:hypothetical protein